MLTFFPGKMSSTPSPKKQASPAAILLAKVRPTAALYTQLLDVYGISHNDLI
jgi:hypothetical protein